MQYLDDIQKSFLTKSLYNPRLMNLYLRVCCFLCVGDEDDEEGNLQFVFFVAAAGGRHKSLEQSLFWIVVYVW